MTSREDDLAQLKAMAEVVEAPVATKAVAKRARAEKAAAVVSNEPRSVNDPDFQMAVAAALIDAKGNPDAVCKRVGCSFADYLAMTARPEFKNIFDQMVYAKVDVPNRIAIRQAITDTALTGNAYAAKTLADTAPVSTADEDEERATADMRTADRKTLGRKLEENIRLEVALLEKIREKRYSLTEHDETPVELPIIAPEDIKADMEVAYEPDESPAPE